MIMRLLYDDRGRNKVFQGNKWKIITGLLICNRYRRAWGEGGVQIFESGGDYGSGN